MTAVEERADGLAVGAPAPASRPWLDAEGRRGLLMISPTLVYVALFLVVPLLLTVAFSFWTQNYLTLDTTFTLKNYQQAWTEEIYRVLMLRSLWISGLVTLITLVLAYPMAYFVAFHGGRHKGLWLFLITIPFWTSYLLRIFAWKLILGFNGVINSGLMSVGLIDKPLEFLLYNTSAVVITLAHAWAPFAILPIFVSLQKIDRSLLEAARDLGDGPVRSFLRVTLPLSLPGVIGAGLIVFIPTVGDYVTPALVGGTKGLMISNMIQLQFAAANNAPLGAALAISAMLIVTAVALTFAFIARSIGGRIR
ncbi:MAG: ABC transporter permease subunit [Rhizobiales bacterium]|nr:ABC transporter permease subunit [Hyphomicrobiales bacterium]